MMASNCHPVLIPGSVLFKAIYVHVYIYFLTKLYMITALCLNSILASYGKHFNLSAIECGC